MTRSPSQTVHEGTAAGPFGLPTSVADVIDDVAAYVAELVTVFDQSGDLLWANAALPRLLGWPVESWIGRNAVEFCHPDDLQLGLELLVSAKATGSGVKEPVVYRLARAGGGWVDMECIASNVELADGEMVLVVTGRPAGQLRPSDAIFDEAASRVSSMFEDAAIGMAQISLHGSVLRANRMLGDIVGRSPDDLLGTRLADLVHPDDRHHVDGSTGTVFADEGSAERALIRLVEAEPTDDSTRYVRLTSSLVRDHRGDPLYYALQVGDVSDLIAAERSLRDSESRLKAMIGELQAAEAELTHRSTHDALTGLANRTLLEQWYHADTGAGPTAMIFIDLDGFKEINDTHGHAVGDNVLVAVAGRLRSNARRSDLVARLGGDEFVVVVSEARQIEAEELAHRLIRGLDAPLDIDGATYVVGASAGLAFAPPDRPVSELLHRADVALYRAKRAGGHQVAIDDELVTPRTWATPPTSSQVIATSG